MRAPTTRPTLWFVGVTTGASSIMRLFPRWAAALGLDAAIAGIDLPLAAGRDAYREVVTFLRDDPLSRGALVTTHKLDLLAAARDLITGLDPLAERFAEVSCLARRADGLHGWAKDPVTAGLAIAAFLAPDHFAKTSAPALVMGAGGAGCAIAWHLRAGRSADPCPQVILAERRADRLAHARHVLGDDPAIRFVLDGDNDALLRAAPPATLVVNATGLGKDAPGSPLRAPVFPAGAVAWDLNYRGELLFLAQARAAGITAVDGWHYFLHGWLAAIEEIFTIPIPPDGGLFAELAAIAEAVR